MALILGYCSAASSLMPLRMSFYKNLNTPGYRKILYYWVILSVIGESLSFLIHFISMMGFSISYPAAPLHLFTVVETVCIIWLFYSYFNDSTKKPFAYGLIIGTIIFEIIQILFFQGLSKMNSNTRALEGVMVIVIVIYFFYHTLEELRIQRLIDSLMFWVSVAFLIYFSGNLFSFALSSVFTNQEIPVLSRQNLSTVHSILNITKNIFITIGIWRMNSSD